MSQNAASVGRKANSLARSEEHTSELQSPDHLVCRLLLEKKKVSGSTTEKPKSPRITLGHEASDGFASFSSSVITTRINDGIANRMAGLRSIVPRSRNDAH